MSAQMRIFTSIIVTGTVFLLLATPHEIVSITPEPDTFISPVSAPVIEFSEGFAQIETATTTQSMNITFVGDILLARHVEYLMAQYGYDYPYRGLPSDFSQSSLVVANFEASIPTRHRKTPDFNFVFSVATTTLPALRSAGITHVSLANNHSGDYQEAGFLHTRRALEEVNIGSFGLPSGLASSSLTILPLGTSSAVSVLALHTLSTTPSEDQIRAHIGEYLFNTDLQIAYVHWGDEYEHIPNSRQRALAQILANMGFDLVIGHHPHVVQSIERIGQTIVAYSLGNFIFDQYFSEAVREHLSVQLSFMDSGEIRLLLLPFESKTMPAQPRLMTAQSREKFLKWLASISTPTLKTSIENGEVIITPTLASSSKTAIMSQ